MRRLAYVGLVAVLGLSTSAGAATSSRAAVTSTLTATGQSLPPLGTAAWSRIRGGGRLAVKLRNLPGVATTATGQWTGTQPVRAGYLHTGVETELLCDQAVKVEVRVRLETREDGHWVTQLDIGLPVTCDVDPTMYYVTHYRLTSDEQWHGATAVPVRTTVWVPITNVAAAVRGNVDAYGT